MVGEFSDAAVEFKRAGPMAILPKMEQEKGEQKANRDTT
jgi:hypothetical protein